MPGVPAPLRGRRASWSSPRAARRSAPASGCSRPRRPSEKLATSAPRRSGSARSGSARSSRASRTGCTRCSATSARSPASAAPGRTRSCTRRGSRRSRSRRSSRRRGGRAARRRRSTRSSTRGLDLRERGAKDAKVYRVHNRLGEPCHVCGDPIAAGRLRRAHDLLLPAVPDRRPRAQGPAPVAAAALGTCARRPARAAAAQACTRRGRPDAGCSRLSCLACQRADRQCVRRTGGRFPADNATSRAAAPSRADLRRRRGARGTASATRLRATSARRRIAAGAPRRRSRCRRLPRRRRSQRPWISIYESRLHAWVEAAGLERTLGLAAGEPDCSRSSVLDGHVAAERPQHPHGDRGAEVAQVLAEQRPAPTPA